jgi:hypothetical protein
MNSSASDLVARLRPIIELLLTSHAVPADEAAVLVEELLRTLKLKRDNIADPEAWFIASLHRALQRLEAEQAAPSNDEPEVAG